MAKIDLCPDHETLERLLLGRLSTEEAAPLDEHLLACETCCDHLRRLVEGDSLAGAARAAGEQALPLDARVRAAIERWREVTLPGKAIEETLARRQDQTTDAWDLEKLLDPPQAAGELGRFGGYRVLRVLGAGGMGLVLEAEDPQLRRRVALKVMQRSLAAHEENRQRFLREARATAAIEHAHIVTVYQVGEHNGLPFLAMQLLKGESLQERLERVRGRVQGSGFRVQDSVGAGAPSGPWGVPNAADAAFLPLPPGEGRGEGGLQRSEVSHSDGKPLGATASPHPNPLPEGEGTRLPLPPDPQAGAPGRGEGASRRSEAGHSDGQPLGATTSPHPNPLPAGEGTRGLLPVSEILRIGREIAEALAEAHQRNLIHRDIKPGNVWLEGSSGWVKLVDFGLAHAAEDVHLTQTGAILGTPAYMSPEQARGETVDGRTDLYSLGAVLYKLTTGEVPFRGTSTMAVLMALATETPRPPMDINPDIPPALNYLILRLLAKKPDDRYESAAAAAEAIREIETSRVGIAHHRVADATQTDPASAAHPQGLGGQCPPYAGRPARPRWSLVAAAAAAALVLATIVIVIRDKDGRETGRVELSEGSSFTVTDKRATAIENRDTPGNGASPDAKSGGPATNGRQAAANIPPPGNFPEPPPLEEWLKCRTLLSVAQDGSGKFKTIQAALDALQPGQVVKVLDAGPYRERLEVDNLPADTGLVSQNGAVLELPGYVLHYRDAAGEYYKGHSLRDMDGFRLAGFTLAFPASDKQFSIGLQTHRGGGFLLERCWIQSPVEVIVGYHAGGSTKPICVRECRFEGLLHLGAVENERGAALVTRNLFSGKQGCVAVGGDSLFEYVGIRDNIFANPLRGLEIHWPKHLSRLEINNNTFLGSNPILFVKAASPGETIVYNNLRLRAGLAALVSGAENERERFLSGSRIAHNCYPSELAVADGWESEQIVPRAASDLLKTPKFISKAVGDRDYLRPVADDPIATAGLGGAWPTYIGALPPGPAPTEGDWFTRLRERWQASRTTESNVGDAKPILPEPPLLEEWLKGRTILTVAQDGSAQFKTIQAALDALKPHQVVKIVDRGPYHERLKAGLPLDTGLISDQQAVIEVSSTQNAEVDERENTHYFGPAAGFRLSGLNFIAPWRNRGIVYCNQAAGFVVEDCRFNWTTPFDAKKFTPVGLWIRAQNDGDDSPPSVVRGCLFDSLTLGLVGDDAGAAFRVERNYFTNAYVGLEGGRGYDAVIRHNVFDGVLPAFDINLKNGIRRLEISNNTAPVAGWGFSLRENIANDSVTICNNITNSGLAIPDALRGMKASILKNWRVDHNSSLRLGSLPKAPGDILEDPKFLSTDSNDRDYLHIPADGPHATGGAGGDLPIYMGALPPGPAPKEGDWCTRLRERWSKVGWALATSESTVGNAHPTIIEPPPLEEWLKDREVLTVAQDGSGKFKTIQAALDALQPGQVVKVLDKGPYRERLELNDVPADTGLVSDVGTALELSAYVPAFKHGDEQWYKGHFFREMEGFRIAGFTFQFPVPEFAESIGLLVHRSAGLVLERCRLPLPAGVCLSFAPGGNTQPTCVRECIIEGMLLMQSWNVNAKALLCRNLFVQEGFVAVVLENAYRHIVIRSNVFSGPAKGIAIAGHADRLDRIEISNNTLLGRNPISFGSPPLGEVTVCNNLLRAGLFLFDRGAAAHRPRMLSRWHVGHNSYPRELTPEDGWPAEQLVPKFKDDVLGTPKFISKDADDRDYLRPVADDPIATAGLGGEWPSYVGALPPGPAPKEGDWFTRLQERWQAAGQASRGGESKVSNARPKDLEEPFVVVSADGTRKAYKRLTAAIAPIRDGDVIEIHGNGPFNVPTIRLENRALSLRAAPGYRPLLKASGKFRHDQSWLSIDNGPLTLEGCDFYGANEGLSFHGHASPWHWRNCRFWSGAPWLASLTDADLTVENCLIRARGCIICSGAANLSLTNNIIRTFRCSILDQAKGKLILTRNTFLGSDGVIGLGDRPAVLLQIEAEGNVFDMRLHNRLINASDTDRESVRQNIHFSGRDNVYCGPSGPLVKTKRDDEVVWGLAAWKAFWASEEPGSIETKELAFAWDSARVLPAAEVDAGQLTQGDAAAFGWKNSNSLYRTGDPYLVERLRTEGHSGDEGSLAAPPLDFEPLQWRLLPASAGYRAGPDGRDLGADFSLIGTVAPVHLSPATGALRSTSPKSDP